MDTSSSDRAFIRTESLSLIAMSLPNSRRIELGMSGQPLSVDYNVGACWTTPTWFRSVWEKVCLFQIDVNIGNIDIAPPRVGDEWLMTRFLQMGFSQAELIHLNQVRLVQQVLFV